MSYEDYEPDYDVYDDYDQPCPACGEYDECDCTDEEIAAAEATHEALAWESDWEADIHSVEARQDRFADPGGDSALWAESASNPRIYPCPTCGAENVLTRKDQLSHNQCDRCSERAEGKEF